MILKHTFTPLNNSRLAHLCGPTDEHLRTIERELEVRIAHRHEQFKVDGAKLTGTAESEHGKSALADLVVSGSTVTFVENLDFQGNSVRIDYKGTVAGDEIKFTRKVAEFATEELVAKRVKE